MIKYKVKNRFSGAVQFTAEIDAAEISEMDCEALEFWAKHREMLLRLAKR